jgi:CRP/FNR family cyclic AMP-dependent transcriptional regulator
MESDESLHAVLEYCHGLPEERHKAGDVLISEGPATGRMFILKHGAIEILRGDTTVAAVDEPGAIFGEMAALLGTGHSATVRAATEASLYRIENARAFLKQHPEIVFHVAVILARRLQDSTIYLADFKRQFGGRSDHFALVDEVLDTLIQRQSKKKTGGSRLRGGADPRLP